jgi:signal transduction histidine kinase
VIAAQEEERKRIARELHDDLSQRLALLSVELEELGREIEKPQTRAQLRKIQSQARDISTDIHRLSYKLHPLKLEHVGLSAAIKTLCNEISRSSNLKVFFSQRNLPTQIPTEITLCLFRITQELLRNCVRHSGAHLAHVYLRTVGNAICLRVSDNGRGFDPKSAVMKHGLGLINVQERLHVVGGQSEIVSKPGRGTCINVSVPLAR